MAIPTSFPNVGTLIAGGLLVIATNSNAEQTTYSAPSQADYPTNVYWGDTHLHTRNSADAYSLGNLNLTPADAYRYARGETLVAHNGDPVRLKRPLDFLVVSDHAEYLGGYYRFNVNDPIVTQTDVGKRWREYVDSGDSVAMMGSFVASINDPDNNPGLPESSRRHIWTDVALTADDYNKPGQFTAFIGYEWTSMINGNNLHRVVVYKDGADKAAALPPFSAQDSTDPRDLWQALERYEAETGGEVMAIPHNGNLSNGWMFPDRSVDGKPINKAYARMSARWEPIYEVTQVKGDSESHPTLSPDDEFADYENWEWDNIGRTEEKQDWMLQHEYARGALKLGLRYEQKLGVNPYKFGLIGSTDGHNTFTTPEEDNFFGKFVDSQPGPDRLLNAMAQNRLWKNRFIVASGYAAIWARENTREALFAALKRKEVYATTGSRIRVRFFGGWRYEDQLAQQPNYAATAYAQGVPMGGDLGPAPGDQAPKFLVVAAKDPDGANLDRVQIVKGWLDRKGKLHEAVYDVAWSGVREPDSETGKVPAIKSTVNVADATFDNSVGAPELAVVWQDPDFTAKQRAFYYARVIEIPRPRWTTRDAAYFQKPLPEDVPAAVQDRAYTSPIWYSP